MVFGTVLKFPVIVCFISLKVPRIVVTIINHHESCYIVQYICHSYVGHVIVSDHEYLVYYTVYHILLLIYYYNHYNCYYSNNSRDH